VSITIAAIDCLHGRPAAGVLAQLERKDEHGWCPLSQARTDDSGQITQWDPEPEIERRIYRVELDLDGYFASLGIAPFMPTAVVSFRILDSLEPCRIAILITPYACVANRVH
jgi:5-hydroxyisourate hydrolase-like protein (transthyretin family)